MTISVMVVDDHSIVRGGLEQLLATVDDMTLVASAANGSEAVIAAKQVRPDVVLMDLSMPVLDGVAATRQIVAALPDTRVIVLTSMADQSSITGALDAGALGYLFKHAEPDEIIAAIREVMMGGAPLDPKVARAVLRQRRDGGPSTTDASLLTEREREVLLLVGNGLANKQIARQLDIAERTVKAHLTSIFQRIGVTDRTRAALWARDHLEQT
jgi:DNA-binding NarL/FixJ family response regulator